MKKGGEQGRSETTTSSDNGWECKPWRRDVTAKKTPKDH